MGAKLEGIRGFAGGHMSEKLLELLQAKKALKEPVEEFLKSRGYRAATCPITKEFMAKPDFYGKREEHTVAVYVVMDPRKIDNELSRVKTVTFQLGRSVDYVLLLSSFDEKKLAELVCLNEDKSLKKIMKDKFMIWMWDPGKKKAVAYFNLPSDKVVREQVEDKGDIVAKARGL
jgi:hypothetical protein